MTVWWMGRGGRGQGRNKEQRTFFVAFLMSRTLHVRSSRSNDFSDKHIVNVQAFTHRFCAHCFIRIKYSKCAFGLSLLTIVLRAFTFSRINIKLSNLKIQQLLK